MCHGLVDDIKNKVVSYLSRPRHAMPCLFVPLKVVSGMHFTRVSKARTWVVVLQMLMNAMETTGANMAARTSWEVIGAAAPRDMCSITSGISVSVSIPWWPGACFSHFSV